MRNVMAHQLFSSRTHDIAINYTMDEGWRQDEDLLHVNPEIYAEQFITSIDGGRLWQWRNFVTDEQLAKQKYLFVRDWLDLPNGDVIAQAIGQLKVLATLADIQKAAAAIDLQICQRYGI
jgi:hypothetical protein